MNGIIDNFHNDQTPEEKRNLLSKLMTDLTENERFLHQFKIERNKYSSDLNSQGYANADNWTEFYQGEIQRLSEQIDILQGELFGEECPKINEENTQGKNDEVVVRSTHPDIRKILESIAPLDG